MHPHWALKWKQRTLYIYPFTVRVQKEVRSHFIIILVFYISIFACKWEKSIQTKYKPQIIQHGMSSISISTSSRFWKNTFYYSRTALNLDRILIIFRILFHFVAVASRSHLLPFSVVFPLLNRFFLSFTTPSPTLVHTLLCACKSSIAQHSTIDK
jgi:hypothetical protein